MRSASLFAKVADRLDDDRLPSRLQLVRTTCSCHYGGPVVPGEFPTDMQVSEPLAGRFGRLSVEAVTCISVDFSARTTGAPLTKPE
jgi:hypothetical protein